MSHDNSGVNSPLAPLPAALEQASRERYAALRDAYGDDLPALDALPGDAARVLACSEYVAASCSRHPEMLRGLLDSGDLESAHADAGAGFYTQATARSVDGCEDESTLMQALRTLKRREMVRIAWRDIARLASFEETLAETSRFADAVLRASVERLHAWQVRELGEPTGRDGEPQELYVLALGKLGAGELNFSSDIDLIYCFAQAGATHGGRRELSNDEYFRRLGQRLINVLSKRTDSGFVFRVDMRLRPFGASGPMALNFDSLEDYYQSHGRDWERYALIRARFVTGNSDEGEALLERLRPFVYRRYFDFGALESIREMKVMIADEIERKGLHDNVKLGPGGIREIEFTGQAFQMVRGGRQAELRDRRILNVIRILGERGYLPAFAVEELGGAYRFLRTTEHRLQQVGDRQEHTLPEDEAGRAVLAAGMGFADWAGFARVLSRHRQRVNAQFSQVFGGEVDTNVNDDALASLWSGNLDAEQAVAVLHAEGYADDQADAACNLIARLKESYTLRVMDAEGRKRLARVMPDLLRAVASQARPSVTLQRIFDIVEAIARRSAYLALLAERPLALSQLVRLCAASPWITSELARHPVLLAALLDPRPLYAPLDPLAPAAEAARRLAAVGESDLEQEMEVLRQFKHANVLHVAAADVSRVMPLMVVSDHLTAIAEVSLRKVVALAWRDMTARYGEPCMGEEGARERAPFAIAAYGKLGGIELGYGSDLDIVFLHGGRGPRQQTDGERSVDNAVFFGRLGQRIIHYLTTATAEGTLYELDFRLRPAGNKGLLVNGIEALRDYLFDEAWTWEHQALVRARVVAGSEALATRFAEIRREVLLAERDPQTLQREVREMRERMRRELGSGDSGEFDLKQDAGGIADIEFMVQYAALRWASRLGNYLDYTDNIRLLEGIAHNRLMAAGDVELLTDAYRAYRTRVHALALQQETAVKGDDELEKLRQGVLRVWQALMEN
ncbi:MAG: bifunctional [glutamate--ammonia ligase]-adenylyl-L-tyrosine phosphorylase/[glutamate--ammonia-ligase] adenylyltransferase [Gammaproteobacteria bacterium]|nr:bifunctional [glutamate--ammonia ligase]-adenylyl-L-tyrosine phosphorylase/[glutamate--ammonia-ligase] adenylyltransferase [Gammaproteobacteria bacterium]